MALIDVNDSNFSEVVLEAQGLVLVDFWAEWCGPCRKIEPAIKALAAERPDITIAKLDVDANPQTAEAYEVLSIPLLIVFRDGKLLTRQPGALPKAKIEALVDEAAASAPATAA